MPTFEEVVPTTGFMTDRQISEALGHDFLIEPGTWEVGQLRHASYTIRLGSKVEREARPAGSRERQQQSIHLTKGGPPLELRPGEKALLYSLENLRLPRCVLGFTVARGLLVYESLVPENTYVDPGFTGQIYTTVTNLSGRVLKLPYGMPIARLFFFRLSEDVQRPYQTGPAIGIDQHLDWSSGIAFLTADEARKASSSRLLRDLIESEPGGVRTAELWKRNARLARAALLTSITWPIAMQVAFGWDWIRSSMGVFIGGVVSSIVASVIIIVAERAWRRISEAG